MSDTKKMTYHITVTDNETGETLHDGDACAIIASINEGDGVSSIISVDCNTVEYAKTLDAARSNITKVCRKHPDVATVAMILGLACKEAAGPETEENEETENK